MRLPPRLLLAPSLLLLAAWPLACGGATDETDVGQSTPGSAGGSAGSAGAGGSSSGSGGSSGEAGQAGSSGKAGSSGAGGSSGQGGSGGAAGQGGSSGQAGQGGSGGAAGQGGSGGSGDVTGSFDLVFKDVKQQKPPFGNVTPPSLSVPVRVDIRKQGDAYEAVFHARFSPTPVAMEVTVSADQVVLKGQATIGSYTSGYNTTDSWPTLVLARSPSGSLSGSFTASGEEMAFGGDVVDSTQISGQGSIGPDTTAPAFKASSSSTHGPTNALLPWDAISLSLAEGITEAQLSPHLSVVAGTPGSDNPAVLWKLKPAADGPVGWAGAVQALAFVQSWDVVAGQMVSVQVSAGAADPSGNAAPAFLSQEKFLAVGPALANHDFDSDAISEGSFGPVGFLGGFAGSDPLCEKGGCVRLGPFDAGVCGPGGVGIAGRLKAPSGSKVSIRYRVSAEGDAGLPPTLYGQAFGVDFHDNQGHVSVTPSDPAPTGFTYQMSQNDLPWSTGWLTATHTVEGLASDDVGFVLYAGTGSDCGGGGPLPPPVKTSIFVDSIKVE